MRMPAKLHHNSLCSEKLLLKSSLYLLFIYLFHPHRRGRKGIMSIELRTLRTYITDTRPAFGRLSYPLYLINRYLSYLLHYILSLIMFRMLHPYCENVTLVASVTLAVLDTVASALVLRILNYCFPLSYFDFALHKLQALFPTEGRNGCVGRVVCSQDIGRVRFVPHCVVCFLARRMHGINGIGSWKLAESSFWGSTNCSNCTNISENLSLIFETI